MSITNRMRWGWAFGCAAAILAAGAAPSASQAQDSASVPDLSGATTGWLAMGTDFRLTPGSPAMVTNDAAHPHFGNGQGAQSSFRFADLNNPNLTDFAKASLKKTNDEVLRGKAVFSREARCWPTGVPTYDLNQAQPVYFIQTPKEVTMIWQMDHQVRHVYLNVPHSSNPKPSWYGESVGHYEGDTLVIDTIGQNTQTYVDNYRTPHSEKLHVVERFHLTNAGKNLQADVVVEDPATFKQPIKVFQTWRRVAQGPMAESSCAESGPGFFAFDVEPIPTAANADF
jgi:hypothetical protein